jgi:pyrroloquinoline quinone biosynthesis protein B
LKIEVLGSVQDGGVPHLSCDCDVCKPARRDSEKVRYVHSIMLRENGDDDSVRYLIGASPDIRFQIKGDYIDGIFLSHNHLGDITGLLWLGQSSMNSSGVPVYCTEDIEDYMMKNDPFRLLIDRGNIDINNIEPDSGIKIQGGIVEPREVINRGDYADTLSFMITGEDKKLYYVTDLDEWTEDAVESVKEADIAIVDGCFWSSGEINRYEEVPHPTVENTIELMKDFDTEIYFTHMNHTNPILRENSEERKKVEENGFKVLEEGMEFTL